MKKIKLFFLPLATIATIATPFSATLTSCGKEEIKEDYTLTMEDTAKAVTTDIYYNEKKTEISDVKKQYVIFEAKLNREIYFDREDGVVKNMVGLPWISKSDVTITPASEIEGAITISEDDVLCAPLQDSKAVRIYVPYHVEEGVKAEDIPEKKLFDISVKVKFYKGTAEEYENDKMHEISKAVELKGLTITNKKSEFIKMTAGDTITPTQSERYYPVEFELDKETYKLAISDHAPGLYVKPTVPNGWQEDIKFVDSSSEAIYRKEYKPRIDGNKLTVYLWISDKIANFNGKTYFGQLPDDLEIAWTCQFVNHTGELVWENNDITNKIKKTILSTDKQILIDTSSPIEIDQTGALTVEATLSSELAKDEILKVSALPQTADNDVSMYMYNHNYINNQHQVLSSDIEGKTVTLNITRNVDEEDVNDEQVFAFECYKKNTETGKYDLKWANTIQHVEITYTNTSVKYKTEYTGSTEPIDQPTGYDECDVEQSDLWADYIDTAAQIGAQDTKFFMFGYDLANSIVRSLLLKTGSEINDYDIRVFIMGYDAATKKVSYTIKATYHYLNDPSSGYRIVLRIKNSPMRQIGNGSTNKYMFLPTIFEMDAYARPEDGTAYLEWTKIEDGWERTERFNLAYGAYSADTFISYLRNSNFDGVVDFEPDYYQYS